MWHSRPESIHKPTSISLPSWLTGPVAAPCHQAEMLLYKEHLNILGCPERGASGDHLRRGVVDVFWHILQLSSGQCRHSPFFGRGPFAELRCFQW
ncbi:hypothetical protein KUCAC02_013795 [Chaenocephalus aceratus]|uniref:Uncharacterized protein n=1 Tax=Chaenocephalus aceratus TaxID=36190 RepID=A0ACB9WCV0_CHAAC|nr:hypothetical protein KUCAC02_013795 [Chaenocephalus aceratus]